MRVSCQLVNRRHCLDVGQEVPKLPVAEGFGRRWRVRERNKVNVRCGAFTWLMDFWEPEQLELKLKLPLGAGVNKGDKSKCKWITSSRNDILVRDSCVIHLSLINNAFYYTLCAMSIVGCRNVPFIQTFRTKQMATQT